MKMKWIVLCVVILSLLGKRVPAHGVNHHLFKGAFGIEVYYDNKAPMQYCEVKVFSPLDGETEFQHGFTDKNGRFTFFPDRPGTWHVIVDDGMGHAVSEDIEVQEELSPTEEETGRLSRVQGVVVGVSVIFGLFGTAALLLSRKRPC